MELKLVQNITSRFVGLNDFSLLVEQENRVGEGREDALTQADQAANLTRPLLVYLV